MSALHVMLHSQRSVINAQNVEQNLILYKAEFHGEVGKTRR
jgi:hypothetical protein